MRILICAMTVVAVWTARADTIYVDVNCPGPGNGSQAQPYCSIQTAIIAAVDTDVVIVAPGTYSERIDFLGKAITVRSSDGPAETSIDGTGLVGPVVTCVTGEGPGTALLGFTITGGNMDISGGMLNLFSSPAVTNCLFSGNVVTNQGGVDPNAWEIVGVGDFDGLATTATPTADILWRNTSSGQLVIWFIQGTALVATGAAGGADPNAWEISGIGDFDGLASTPSSTADILWRNTNGQVFIWLMDGALRIGQGSPGGIGQVWKIAGAGDFDGDGHSDILWRNQSAAGQVFAWFIDGTSRVGQGPMGSVPHVWQIAGTDDFDGE